jgi:hypothetical protein
MEVAPVIQDAIRERLTAMSCVQLLLYTQHEG